MRERPPQIEIDAKTGQTQIGAELVEKRSRIGKERNGYGTQNGHDHLIVIANQGKSDVLVADIDIIGGQKIRRRQRPEKRRKFRPLKVSPKYSWCNELQAIPGRGTII